jgi:hypothetical protein
MGTDVLSLLLVDTAEDLDLISTAVKISNLTFLVVVSSSSPGGVNTGTG